MELELPNFLTAQIAKAICATLIHSLWQGLAVALVAAVTVVLTKKASAALRYKLLIVCFSAFIIAVLMTFNVQLSKAHSSGQSPSAINFVAAEDGSPAQTSADTSIESLFFSVYDYLNAHSSTVVLIWFLVICIKYLGFVAGLHHVYMIRRTQVRAAGRHWETKLEELSVALGIRRKVAILQSGLAKSPMTIGYLKPMILIPIGLLNRLSVAEVEAILLHELSHIHRSDYMVNIFQQVVEIIFFFNPALLWLSALIKAEREHCCDEMAVSKTGDKRTYIQALLSCQQYSDTKHAMAMGLSGRKSGIVGRVRRIVSNNNQSLNVMEKGVLTLSMVTTVLITLTVSSTDAGMVKKAVTTTQSVLVETFTGGSPAQFERSPVQSSPVKAIRKGEGDRLHSSQPIDSLLSTERRISAGGNGKLADLSVDGDKLARNHIVQYLPEVEGRHSQAKVAEDARKVKADTLTQFGFSTNRLRECAQSTCMQDLISEAQNFKSCLIVYQAESKWLVTDDRNALAAIMNDYPLKKIAICKGNIKVNGRRIAQRNLVILRDRE
ncbi:M56 family metallopeptidase [Pedobacter faecalis]|uniref:M56 family metallopeptidase n=1 Tax=Pedobacter faecalis TaxID=3041495 RepID=UPI00254ECAF5|nr:M56 family metallopeptidase [Pedobacter sp. ELA7]